MALDHVDALDHDAPLVGHQAQHAAALALVLAGDDDDLIPFADVHDYRTSGASEMIFMNRLARSSRATGPKMRVPTGSLSLSTSTAEFVSKRMYEPSWRDTSFFVRTITAFAISPFFTLALGMASLIETTITSPSDAYLRLVPP